MSLYAAGASIVGRIINWRIPPGGSRLSYAAITLASTSYEDLVGAITNSGMLVAVGWRRSGTSGTNFLDAIETTIDGGAATEITGLGDSDESAQPTMPVSNESAEYTRWIPLRLPFGKSISVRAKTFAAVGGNVYVYAIIQQRVT